MKSEKSKILFVIIILLALTFGIVAIRKNSKPVITDLIIEEPKQEDNIDNQIPASENNIIFLKTDRPNIKVGDNFDVTVSFSAPGKRIFGSDVVLLYDPEILSTNQENIVNGSFFESVPKKSVDPKNGIIKISAYGGADKSGVDSSDIISIKFIANSAGTSKIDVAFEKGTTNTTTLVEDKTSKNILEKTNGLTVKIEN